MPDEDLLAAAWMIIAAVALFVVGLFLGYWIRGKEEGK